jgi:hypothetical protein
MMDVMTGKYTAGSRPAISMAALSARPTHDAAHCTANTGHSPAIRIFATRCFCHKLLLLAFATT